MKINGYFILDGEVKSFHVTDPKRGLDYVLFERARTHGECNQCRYYEGVHGAQGHAPCAFWRIGGVLSSDYCSRFEREGE